VLSRCRSGALTNLREVTQEYGSDLSGIQEIEWAGKSMLEEKNCTMYYSCHEKQHCFGSKLLRTQVIDFKPMDTKTAALSVHMLQQQTKVKWRRVSFMSN
jgi:hypothetical protein